MLNAVQILLNICVFFLSNPGEFTPNQSKQENEEAE